VKNATLENLVISENASIGLYAWSTGHKFRHLTIADNGLLGFGANRADGLQLTDSRIERNNQQHFKAAPVSGGAKLHLSKNVLIKGNRFAENVTTGLWFDNWADTVTIVSNEVVDNGTHGILLEAGARFTVADNRISGNDHTGLEVYNSSEVELWNNTIVAERRAVWFMQDERRNSDPTIPLVIGDVTMHNNVIVYGTDGCPVLTQDTEKKLYGNDFGITSDANLYARTSATSPSNFACWANGSAGTQGIKTLESFRSVTGGDGASRLIEGVPVVGSTFGLTPQVAASNGVAPEPLPSSIASSLGVPAGSTWVGAFTAPK
jgi:parallel beta-helix repeat protein